MAAFAAKGPDVRISEIFQDSTPVVESDETLVLMFPVHACDAPRPVYKWISGISCSKGGKAVVVSVLGGGEILMNTASRIKSINCLVKKGFHVSNEYMLCMPANFIASTEEALALKLLEVLPEKCGIIADEVIGGIERRKKPLFADRVMLILCQPEKLGARLFGRTMRVSGKCSSCGLCASKCPMSNINMENGKPRFQWKCALCMRCIYACPKKAISPRLMKMFVIKNGFDIASLQKKT